VFGDGYTHSAMGQGLRNTL